MGLEKRTELGFLGPLGIEEKEDEKEEVEKEEEVEEEEEEDEEEYSARIFGKWLEVRDGIRPSYNEISETLKNNIEISMGERTMGYPKTRG
uniref:Uncharacterized protein n=1 Tax=Vespula pensylvanica TaxID=30213 RepID=A0A834P0Z4_VESPE|nr:hypothetical protein H0235_008885 [Vespula pensylvanica]